MVLKQSTRPAGRAKDACVQIPSNLIVMPEPASFQQSVRSEKDLLQRLAALAQGKRTLQDLAEECRRVEGNLFLK